jgi:Zn-finger nucleic acid-binding protein
LEWRSYSRTGRVYAAGFRQPAVVTTTSGPVDASPGDYLVVDVDFTQVRHYTADEFAHCFNALDRPVPIKALPDLSGVVVTKVADPTEDRAGEPCARCGNRRTSREFEGVLTCGECELAIKAEREDRMDCVHDGTLMRKEVIEGVIVDRCPDCGGVWFDGGELEVLSNVLRLAADQGMPSRVASRLFQSLIQRIAE